MKSCSSFAILKVFLLVVRGPWLLVRVYDVAGFGLD